MTVQEAVDILKRTYNYMVEGTIVNRINLPEQSDAIEAIQLVTEALDEKKEAIEARRNKEQEFARVYGYKTDEYYKALKQSDDFADALDKKFNKYKF